MINEKEKLNIRNYYQIIKMPFILDGAIGSYLEINYPHFEDKFTWMSSLNTKDDSIAKILIDLYQNYIESGAQIITTNTFSTNPTCLIRKENNLNNYDDPKYLTESSELVSNAVNICRKIKNKYLEVDKNIYIAGSNSPAEYCYSNIRTYNLSQIKHNHINHINFLYQNEVDFILNETFSLWDEIKIVLDHCEGNNIPYAISMLITEDLKLFSGEDISEIIEYIDNNYNPLFISINCIFYKTFNKFIQKYHFFINQLKNKFGFYFNCGSENFNKLEKSIHNYELNGILKEVYKFINKDKIFCIGLCCMSDPSYTKEIYNFLYKQL